MPREADIISTLRRRAKRPARVRAGIGDDAAIFEGTPGKDTVACCDLLIEGVHFRRGWSRLMGQKALAVNLSDVAAMGALPLYALLSVAFPPASTGEFVETFLEMLLERADHFGVALIGGDTSSSPGPMFIDVTVIGECETGRALTRGGAAPGDSLFVTGSLGASSLGLTLLERSFDRHAGSLSRGEFADLSDIQRLARLICEEAGSSDEGLVSAIEAGLRKHLAPEPRVKLGGLLGGRKLASSMIDISDGLSTDLGHIADESRCGAVIDAEAIPMIGGVDRLRETLGLNFDALERA